MKVKDSLLGVMICIYIFLLPIIPDKFEMFNRQIKTDYFLVLIYIVFVCITLASKELRGSIKSNITHFVKDPTTVLMIILLLIMLFSTGYSLEKKLALSESLRFLNYVLLFFIIKYGIRYKVTYNYILVTYLVSAFFVSIIGIVMYFNGINVQNVYGEIRAESTFGNSNSFAAFLIISIFPILMLLFKGKYTKLKILISMAVASICIAIVLSGSRNAFLAFGIGMIVLCIFFNWRTIGLLIPLSVVLLLIPKVNRRIFSLFSSTQDDSRIKLWKTAVAMIREHPILGVGNGNYVSQYDIYVKKYPELAYPDYKRFTTHNSYLKVESELGIFGILSFFGILAVSLYRMKKYIEIEKEMFFSFFFTGMFASVVAFYFMNISDNLFFVPKITTYYWILTAIQQGICAKGLVKQEEIN